MKKHETITAYLARFLALACLLSLFGCGMIVTQESAKNAIDDAQAAIDLARDTDADVYSAGNLNRAEKLLAEAEMALSRKRRQRAYRLATQAEKAARAAEEEARQSLEEPPAPDTVPQPGVIETGVSVPPGPMQPTTPIQQPITPSITYVFPSLTQPTTPLPQGTGPAPSIVPVQGEIPLSDLQNRVQAAVQALAGAQSAVQAAQILVLRIQVDIGLSMEDATIQQVQGAGASREMVSLIRSWYDQARRAAAVGNYENALRFLEGAQTYVRVIIKPME